MPCSYFKAVWGFILIADPAPTVIQLLLGAFAAAASLSPCGPVSSHQSPRVAWGSQGDRMRCKATPSHVHLLHLRTHGCSGQEVSFGKGDMGVGGHLSG